VAAGECVALLGRNGVGKSTTMRSIMGLTAPARGRVLWKARDLRGRAPYQVARAGLGFVPEDRRIFSDLSVWGTRRRRRGAVAAGRWSASTSCSRSSGAARPTGRLPLRRRAADAHDRPHADGNPDSCCSTSRPRAWRR
jgi:hypothetical protein